MPSDRNQATKAALRASIAATAVGTGRVLTPEDVADFRAYLDTTPDLNGWQRVAWRAVLDSHEQLRTERIIHHYGL